MALRTRIAIWALALAFVATPSLAMAADCAGCCCPPTPCHQVAGDCAALEAAMSCCDLEPAAAPASGLRAFQASADVAVLPFRVAHPSSAARLAAPLCPGPVGPLVSPLRLSVVQRN